MAGSKTVCLMQELCTQAAWALSLSVWLELEAMPVSAVCSTAILTDSGDERQPSTQL